MVAHEGKSLVVDFPDLLRYSEDLANKVLLEPDSSLDAFRKAAYETLRSESPVYADRIRKGLAIRVRAIPDSVALRKVDTSYLDKMLAVAGMVVRTSELRPLMVEAAFVCPSGHVTFREQDELAMKKPDKCDLCSEARNFELDKAHSTFIDYQTLRIQELPEDLPPGQLPQFFDVSVEGDIVNTARPGDRVILTGIVRAVQDYSVGQIRTTLFRSQIECNFVEVKGKETEEVQLTKEDEAIIREIASSTDAYEKLVHSVAPAILGHDSEKEAILLLLAGGNSTSLPDGTRLRGDINVLFVGDPGVAKSEMLKFAAQVAPRGLFASGRGTTAAGLSAAVIREKNTLMLEAGVVVLADQGIACLTGENEIYTGGALVPVQKLWESGTPLAVSASAELRSLGEFVPSFQQKTKSDIRGNAFRIARRQHSGEVIELTFSSGLKLRVTPEHLVRRYTQNRKWLRADQLQVGDLVKGVRKLFGPTLKLAVDPRMAYLVGAVYGDGYIGKGQITISQSKTNIDVVNHISSISPVELSTYVKKETERHLGPYVLVERPVHLWTSNKDLFSVCTGLLKPSIDRVLMLPDDSLAAFFAGIFDTDGDFNHMGTSVIAVRIYPTRAEHELAILLHALRRFSIRASIRRTKKGFPLLQITGEDISRFLKVVAPFSAKAAREYNSKVELRHKRKHLAEGVDRVVDVRREAYEGPVYDLVVPDHNNFAGSLVYVHNCIDEFDKMRKEDTQALHEQMEQQQVTVAKGGIYATLNARTAILAASNPLLGRYNAFQNITENIPNLPIPLLTRFDLILVIRDTPQPADDERLAAHILAVRSRKTYASPPPVEFGLLRKYIQYCKKVSPTLSKDAMDRIKDYYLDLRRNSADAGIPPTPRTLEALIRLSTARARILLREEVSDEDALAAISLMNRMVEDVLTDASTKKPDFGIQMGKPVGETKKLAAAIDALKRLEGPDKKPVETKLLKEELVKAKIGEEEADKLIKTMFREGIIYESRPGFVRRVNA